MNDDRAFVTTCSGVAERRWICQVKNNIIDPPPTPCEFQNSILVITNEMAERNIISPGKLFEIMIEPRGSLYDTETVQFRKPTNILTYHDIK